MTHPEIIETLLSRLTDQAVNKASDTGYRTGAIDFEEEIGGLTITGQCDWSVMYFDLEYSKGREVEARLVVWDILATDADGEEVEFPRRVEQ